MRAVLRYGALCLIVAACGPVVKDDGGGEGASGPGLSGGDPVPPPAETTDPGRDPPGPTPTELGSTGPPLPKPPPEPQSMAYWIKTGTKVRLVVASWTADICDAPELVDPECGSTQQWFIGIDLDLPIEPGDYDFETNSGWAAVRTPSDADDACEGEGASSLGRGRLRIDEVGEIITGSLIDAEVAFQTAPMTVAFDAPRCP